MKVNLFWRLTIIIILSEISFICHNIAFSSSSCQQVAMLTIIKTRWSSFNFSHKAWGYFRIRRSLGDRHVYEASRMCCRPIEMFPMCFDWKSEAGERLQLKIVLYRYIINMLLIANLIYNGEMINLITTNKN